MQIGAARADARRLADVLHAIQSIAMWDASRLQWVISKRDVEMLPDRNVRDIIKKVLVT